MTILEIGSEGGIENFLKTDLGVRQGLFEYVVLIDRQVIAEAWVDLKQADAAALQLQFLDAFDHDFGEAAAAAVTDV